MNTSGKRAQHIYQLIIIDHFCMVLFFGLHRLAAFYKSFSDMRKIRLLIIIEQYTKDDALQKEKEKKKKKKKKISAHCMKE